MDATASQEDRTSTRDVTKFALADVADVLWTLTERCNLACAYCDVVPHGGARPHDPTRAEVDHILAQLRRLPGLQSLILSGGEALLSPHIEHVLARTGDLAPTRYLITNGTTVRARQKRLLEEHRPRTMITIDSLDEDANAKTRGEVRGPRAVDTLRWALEAGLYTVVILVLTRHNVRSVRGTLVGLARMGVQNVLLQQLHCPTSRMAPSFAEMLPPVEEVHALHEWLSELRRERPDMVIDDNEVCFFERRPAQRRKKCSPDVAYLPQRLFMCGAGFDFFALKANGDVLPCNAFLNVPTGNIHRANIEDILAGSEVMAGLRRLRTHRVNEIPGCAGCPEVPICDGGCRADVFNATGEIGNPHPACPRHAGSPRDFTLSPARGAARPSLPMARG